MQRQAAAPVMTAASKFAPPARRRALPRYLLPVGAALAVLMALVWALWPRPIGADVAAVTTGPMAVTVDEEGKTRIKDVFLVSAPQSGRTLRSTLTAGDEVVAGKTLLAVIFPAPPAFLDTRARLEATGQIRAAEAAVQLAEAELTQARSELAFAESELARARSLARSETIATRALEKAGLDFDVRKAATARAEAQLLVRRQELETARSRLVGPGDDPLSNSIDAGCCIEVRAPISGRVLKVLVTSEQTVQIGTPLVEIGDPGRQEIVVELLSIDAVKVREGAAATIEGWGGRGSLRARVRRIETAGFTKVSALGIEEQRVRVVLDPLPSTGLDGTLGHEYRVLARILTWQAESAVKVPIGALFREQGRWAVFRLENGRAILRPIEIDHRNADVAEVVSGLAAGDRVVLHPSDRIRSGSRIAPRAVAAQ